MTEHTDVELTLHDPVLSEFELPRRALYYPLGFALELQTNSEDVIRAAEQSWGLFAAEFEGTPVRISLGVSESSESPLPPPPGFRSRGHLMSIVSDAENFVICDFSRGFAFGWITPAVAANHGFLRYHFLEAAEATLLDQLHLAPIHAALVARNGKGVLLCGESLAGKSTLAYACARAGWTYVTDDGTCLLRDRNDSYGIGDPHVIHFREDARRLFPELADRLVITRSNGKLGLEIFTRDLSIALATGSAIDHAVFLNRGESGPARLKHYSKSEFLLWCERCINYGEEDARAAQRRSYQRLAGAGTWEMDYHDLDSAVKCLETLVACGGA
jgi:hypothetical protein